MIATRVLGYSLGLAACTLIPLAAVVQGQTKTTQSSGATMQQKPQSTTPPPAQHQSEGERIFAQNCSRCHNAPDGFPPSISATVVRHMRVRAQLSEHDEQELLRFFNP